MKILTKTIKYISRFQGSVIQFPQCWNTQIRSLSSPVPVKLAFSVFNESGTNENAPPIIIMHGLMGWKQNWRSVSVFLNNKSKRKIYAVDARNHGDSPHDDNHDSAHLAEDVRLLIENENLHRVSLIGHSMGGKAMMYFSLKYPQLVEKVIIVDISPVSIPKNFHEVEQILTTMASVKIPSNLSFSEGRLKAEGQLMSVINDKATVDFLMQNLKKSPTGEFVWRANVKALMRNLKHIRDTRKQDLPPFSGPVMFIAGKKSNFLNPDDWPKIKKIFPNAELEWFNCGHLVHLEQPSKFLETVTNFLNK